MSRTTTTYLEWLSRRWLPWPSTPPDKEQVNNILIYGHMGIGDLICLTPALKGIRDFYSHAHIALVASQDSTRQLMEHSSLVDELLAMPPGEGLTWRRLVWGIAVARRQWDLVVASHHGTNLVAITLLSRAPFRVGIVEYTGRWQAPLPYVYNLPISVPGIEHRSRSNMRILRALGIPVPDVPRAALEIPQRAHDQARVFLEQLAAKPAQPLVILQPGSSAGQHWKSWPSERFVRLAALLQDELDAAVVAAGSPDEDELMRQQLSGVLSDNQIAAGKLDLLATASLIQQADLFVGNDSGLAHVAGAVGTRAVVIFGPTDPRICKPLGEGHRILQADLDCQPCFFYGPSQNQAAAACHRECLSAIELERVVGACQECLHDSANSTEI